jgi:E3 ubiquitin-protein ligase listerin
VSQAPKHIREASYELLGAYVRRTKEQVEIEAALATNDETGDVRSLPEELLSIIVNTDFLYNSEDPEAETSRRRILEGYLMAWSLIFQHFVDSV